MTFTMLAACGGSGSAPATPPPLDIVTATIAGGTVGVAYSAALAASGGTGADSWTVQSGALPSGIDLSAAGVLSGTPSEVGITTFTIAANDSGTPQQTATQTYNLIVAASGTATQLTLATTPSSIHIDSSFAGLSYEKNTLSKPLFSPGNTPAAHRRQFGRSYALECDR
jgi:hypothetical protein